MIYMGLQLSGNGWQFLIKQCSVGVSTETWIMVNKGIYHRVGGIMSILNTLKNTLQSNRIQKDCSVSVLEVLRK